MQDCNSKAKNSIKLVLNTWNETQPMLSDTEQSFNTQVRVLAFSPFLSIQFVCNI